MNTVIQAESLGKYYRIYHRRWHQLAEWVWPARRWHERKWVFRGVSLQVSEGEAVAIIGRNGAGKSTLLKVLCGVTSASEGHYCIRGRVAAILELGLAFNEDFTGRENAYLAASLMGYGREAVDTKIDWIQSFSGIGEAFDQPVRVYSSGMRVRLAFSVATAFRPDVLIVDEALSVGDVAFQSLCFRRVREFLEQGTALLFVSHDPTAIRSLCSRAVLLEEGRVVFSGPVPEALDYYNALIAGADGQADITIEQADDSGQSSHRLRSGNHRVARIIRACWVNCQGNDIRVCTVGSPVRLQVTFEVFQAVSGLTVGFMLRDRVGNVLYGTNTWHLGLRDQVFEPGVHTVVFEIEALHVGPGQYLTTVALHDFHDHVAGNYDWWDGAVRLDVVADGRQPEFVGMCALKARVEVAR